MSYDHHNQPGRILNRLVGVVNATGPALHFSFRVDFWLDEQVRAGQTGISGGGWKLDDRARAGLVSGKRETPAVRNHEAGRREGWPMGWKSRAFRLEEPGEADHNANSVEITAFTSGLPAAPVTTNLQPASAENIAPLTGLRFVAALAVVCVHSLQAATGNHVIGGLAATNAVSVFFVLSGFILTWVYSGRLTTAGVGMFWWARFARIWPLYVACLILVVAARMVTGRQAWDQIQWSSLWYHLGLLQSWLLPVNFAFGWNGPAWSVSTEMGFYLLFPLLVIPGPRRFCGIWLLVAAGTAAGLAALQLWVWQHPESESWGQYVVYVNPLFRLLEFATGVGTGFVLLSLRSRFGAVQGDGSSLPWWRTFADTAAELLAIGLAGYLLWQVSDDGRLHPWLVDRKLAVLDTWFQRGGAAMWGYAAIIGTLAWSRGLIAQYLSGPLMVWLGEASYALYLVQWSVIVVAKWLRGSLEMPPTAVVTGIILVSLGIAVWLHSFLERPARLGLVSLVRGEWRKLGQAVRGLHRELWHGGVGLSAVLLVGAGAMVFWYERGRTIGPDKEDPGQSRAIGMFAGGSGAIPPTLFRGQAVLHAIRAEDRGVDVRVNLLWEVLPGCTMSRFVHICDESGQILRQGAVERERFAGAGPHCLVVDEIVLSKKALDGGRVVGVGFFEQGKGTAIVERGRRGLGGRRLEILQIGPNGVEVLTKN